MRCLLKVSIPVERGNTTISDGTLPKTIESILDELKPEAAYFAEENGKRTGFVFFDLKDTSQIPAVAEPHKFQRWPNPGSLLSMRKSNSIRP